MVGRAVLPADRFFLHLSVPQAGVVEAGGFTESIVAPAMSIAGQVIEELEFAKDGEIGTGYRLGRERF